MDITYLSDWNILGHENIKRFLTKSIVNDKLSHAYLFLGPSGVGKKQTAYKFLNSIACHNDSKDKKNIPCGSCSSCRIFNSANFPDLHLVEKSKEKNSISINKIRSLIHELNLRPLHSDYKFALIEADFLTLDAFNSFLKTLEEPAAKTIIILLSTNISHLPETIVSRCQIIRFNRLKNESILDDLLKNKVDKRLAKELTLLSEGKPGKIEDFVKNGEIYSNYKDEVKDLFLLLKSNLPERLDKVTELFGRNMPPREAREKFGEVMANFLSILRDSLLLKIKGDNEITNYHLKNIILNNNKNITEKYLQNLIRLNLNFQKLVKNNLNPKLVFENFVLNI